MAVDEWIAPAITGGFGLVVGIVGALMARRGQKLGNRETRAPDVQEIWAQQEEDRLMRRAIEDLWWALRRAFQSYYRRVSSTLLHLNLPEDVAKKFELTSSELKAIEAKPPDGD